MTSKSSPVIIGDRSDIHVQAVLERVGSDALVIDASSLSRTRYVLRDGQLEIEVRGRTHLIDGNLPSRGWIRRLAPPSWHAGVVLESHDAAVQSAWLALVAAIVRVCGVRWLTPIEPLVASENKMVQLAAANAGGIATASTLVTNDAVVAAAELGDQLVLKPLGPSHYIDAADACVIFASKVPATSPVLGALGGAPFIVQEPLAARQHLRVVTVEDSVWGAGIDATDLPMDWRQDRAAHRSFVEVELDEAVATGARAVSERLGLGYSSQDWLVCADGRFVLLDVNPAGQWLFLPAGVAERVSSAIAAWLLRG